MKSYSEITGRYLKQNKKRTILTIVGIILAISLFSGIGNLFFSMRDGLVANERKNKGNYEVKYFGVNKDKVNKLSNNFEIKDYGVSKDNNFFILKDDKNNENKSTMDNKPKIINLDFYDNSMLNNVMTINMKEGRKPKAADEIILEKRAKTKFGKKVGDYIEANNIDPEVLVKSLKVDSKITAQSNLQKLQSNEVKKYKIVGYYEKKVSQTSDLYEARGYLNKNSMEKDENYSFYANLKEKKNKVDIGKKVGSTVGLSENKKIDGDPEIIFNDAVLRLMAEGNDTLLNKDTMSVFIFIATLIIVCTVAVIYNAFNISVAERINQFGVLRSIGATPGKIRKLVFKEAFIMSIIAIPIGIISGYLGIYTTIKLMSNSERFVFEGLKIGFYKEVILICIVLTLITIILSVLGPAIKASKVSPIDAIRNSSNLKKEKIRRRKGRLIKLIFGIEGAVAYKNIRRNNKRFIITVFSLMISLIMFIIITSMTKMTDEVTKQLISSAPFDAVIQTKESMDEKFISEIKSKDDIKKVYTPKIRRALVYLEKDILNEKYYEKINKDMPKSEKIKGKDYVCLDQVTYSAYDKSSLEQVKNNLVGGKIDTEALNNNGVLLINRNEVSKKNGGRVVADITKYKVGDKIRIPRTKDKFYSEMEGNKKLDLKGEFKQGVEKGDFIELTIVGILNKDIFNISAAHDSIGLVFSDKCFEKNFGKLPIDSVAINYKNEKAGEKYAGYFEEKAEELQGSYMDLHSLNNQMDSIQKQISVFMYGFIAIITIIGMVNIINTITIGLLLRKSEFATLTAIGMTKSQLNKMVMLEGLLHGIFTSVFGSIISYILYNLLLKQSFNFINFDLKFPIDVFITGILGVIAITLLASVIPLRRLKKMSIVENIRAKE
ncbi:FtsX-like permease family protein [Clostridium botulinum]|uniref:Putative ABC transporter, permease protein n=1 Tax=Clostridium botulinum (strain Langeland / NCTC 10281 / Type F) TaxID=441772 RepID=A7GBI2_CLOBL|nr:ABC transporter permease [Clostridium botulinum]ABS41799.1 putative ABC transporter, permease protein [Clostridium botulinum F str. Langeland]ADF98609.1 putative ABC transporter, permease protein [Clostridium botulinum F str. 230613]KKM40106.1 ABC transporter permease [Clostridium botulinum]MBN3346615.1 ABC transporter permease [Clostridium botulinum]MBY6791877.1 FtsX-like permease family protein [Clostridium botulinum]